MDVKCLVNRRTITYQQFIEWFLTLMQSFSGALNIAYNVSFFSAYSINLDRKLWYPALEKNVGVGSFGRYINVQ